MAAGARVFEYTALEPSIQESGGRIIPYHALLGDLELRNIHFQYPTRPDQPVLQGLSLRVPPSKVVALVNLLSPYNFYVN